MRRERLDHIVILGKRHLEHVPKEYCFNYSIFNVAWPHPGIEQCVPTEPAFKGVTFDTGMLVALERRHAGALALLRACRLSRALITIPAAVVAEW